MQESIEIKEKTKGDILILSLKGRLDALSTGNAESIVTEQINKGNVKIIFDFAGIDYLSSAGMRLLLRTTKRLRSSDGKLVVCSINHNVMDILKLSGFDSVIEISNSEAEALNRFKANL
jgi:anti-sigma B factor antagonist/stage II sporulation protein AA (anti-sigma F factor antagonist)